MSYYVTLGTLEAKVIYEVSDDAKIKIDYYATTDRPTIVCLSNHAFFNMEGHVSIIWISVK